MATLLLVQYAGFNVNKSERGQAEPEEAGLEPHASSDGGIGGKNWYI
jgi:hypothetical protein